MKIFWKFLSKDFGIFWQTYFSANFGMENKIHTLNKTCNITFCIYLMKLVFRFLEIGESVLRQSFPISFTESSDDNDRNRASVLSTGKIFANVRVASKAGLLDAVFFC